MFESEIANLYTAAIMVFAALVPVLNPFGGAMFFLTLTNGVVLIYVAQWPIVSGCTR